MTATTLANASSRKKLAVLTGVVALYVRVSTVEQSEEGISLDAQEAELRRLAEQRWPDSPIVVFREEGKSAREGKNRPVYDVLRERAEEGHVRAIVSVERSRLARSVTEWLALRKLCAEQGIHLETVNGGVEDPSATGRLLGTMLAAVAEFESDLKSERVVRAVKHLQTSGLWHGGSLPFTLAVGDDRILRATESTLHVVRAFERADAGASVKEIARELSEATGEELTPSYVRQRVLRNAHYAGYIVRGRGKTQKREEGRHEAFVARDLWHRVQGRLDANQATAARHPRKNPFGALVRCHCGGRLERHLQASGKYVALRCEHRKRGQCKSPYLPFENFEATVVSTLGGVFARLTRCLADPEWNWYIDSPEEQRRRQDRLVAVTTDLAELEGRFTRLYDAYESGAIDRDKYLARSQELNEQRAALELQRAELSKDETTHREALEALRDTLGGAIGDDVDLALRPVAQWLGATTDERHELLRTIIRSIEVLDEDQHRVAISFRAGPVLTRNLSTKRTAESAFLRSVGFGLCVSEPRAPPRTPSLRSGVADSTVVGAAFWLAPATVSLFVGLPPGGARLRRRLVVGLTRSWRASMRRRSAALPRGRLASAKTVAARPAKAAPPTFAQSSR